MKAFKLAVIFIGILGLTQGGEDLSRLYDLQLNRCAGKNGLFLPIPGSCTQYVICVDGIGVLSTCGAYHFDARRSVCDHPAKAGCITFGPELIAPSKSECAGKSDGTKVPLPGSTSKFSICIQEKEYVQDCGALQFDPITQQCIHIARDPITDPNLMQQGPCFNVADGVKLAVPGNSQRYYFCLNRKSFIKDCGNMFFSPKHSACVLTLDDGSQTNGEDDTGVIPAQEVPGRHDALGQSVCRNQKLGSRVAVPGSCTDYYVCMNNIGIPKSCGTMQFNPMSKSCDLATNVRCRNQPTGVIYDAPERPVVAANSTDAIVCSGQRDGIFVAAPGKCSDFYFCMKNRGFRKTCGPRHFSPITLSCVDVDESNCVDMIPFVPLEVDQSMSACIQRENGILLKHPTDCGKFLICDHQKPVAMDCPAGLHFNSQRSYCDWPAEAKCV